MMAQSLHRLLETTLEGMGYELVELEFGAAGLLRLFIDRPVQDSGADSLITIEDCELVSRHFTRLMEVENINYQRLEVSSPGLDRLLSKPSDFERFAGQLVLVKLRQALSGRKNFEGILVLDGQDAQGNTQYGIDYDDPRKGVHMGQPLRMNFILGDVDKARLVPQIDFKKHTKKAKE